MENLNQSMPMPVLKPYEIYIDLYPETNFPKRKKKETTAVKNELIPTPSSSAKKYSRASDKKVVFPSSSEQKKNSTGSSRNIALKYKEESAIYRRILKACEKRNPEIARSTAIGSKPKEVTSNITQKSKSPLNSVHICISEPVSAPKVTAVKKRTIQNREIKKVSGPSDSKKSKCLSGRTQIKKYRYRCKHCLQILLTPSESVDHFQNCGYPDFAYGDSISKIEVGKYGDFNCLICGNAYETKTGLGRHISKTHLK